MCGTLFAMAELIAFTVYVRPELLAWLRAAALADDRPLSSYMARVLEAHATEGAGVASGGELTEAT
jgi:hypothetical protein